ncbi:putative ribonuclease H-like domain-containing protein [Tanacetum coccineum]|uniref:Ribonuclease H-like domain-containing protein n=1 Tax=Tanacetum coccineum TaxID=301880 RepID=A0ABQ5AQZ0_9ASTR
MIKNKARLVAQGYTQEEGILKNISDEVFAPVARIEAIRLFLAYASFKDFVVYQMDVKSAFLYGKIEEDVYVCQLPGFEDPDFPDRVYKVEKELNGLHQTPRAWYETLPTYLLDNGFQRGKIDKTLFIKRDKGDILQDKYVNEILNKFGFSDVKTARTPMETQKALLKDADGEDVDEHLYRSMIGSLMYLTSSRPDIMFAVCACARFQVNPKVSHLHAVKRNFRYLKGQPKLGLWVQLISWANVPKQTVVANSTTEAEYLAASNCYGHGDFIALVRAGDQTSEDARLLGLHLQMEERLPYTKIEEVRMKASQCEEGCFKEIEGNAKEYQICDVGGKGRRKEKISSKEVVFTKADESSSVLAPEITSDSESECDSQEPLPPLPKLIGAAPSWHFRESYFFCPPAYALRKRDSRNLSAGPKPFLFQKGCTSIEKLLLTTDGKRYSKESGPKVVFREDSSGDTEGYGLEVDINKKAENQAKMTKLSMEWK